MKRKNMSAKPMTSFEKVKGSLEQAPLHLKGFIFINKSRDFFRPKTVAPKQRLNPFDCAINPATTSMN